MREAGLQVFSEQQWDEAQACLLALEDAGEPRPWASCWRPWGLGPAGWRGASWRPRRAAGAGGGRAGACLLLSAFCFWLWYDLYLIRDFNELGRDYDPVDQVVYTDSGFVWIVPALLLLAAGAWLAGQAALMAAARPGSQLAR